MIMDQNFTAAVLLTETIVRSPTVVPADRSEFPDPVDVVREWHAEVGHVGRFEYCSEQPCRAIERARSV